MGCLMSKHLFCAVQSYEFRRSCAPRAPGCTVIRATLATGVENEYC